MALLAAVAALTGCGGGGEPHARRADVASLIALAHRIPREPACAQARDIRALRSRTSAAVNAGRVPAALAESLSSGVNALVEETPLCVPVVAPASTTPVVLPPPAPRQPHGHPKPKPPHGHGHGKGHGKGHHH